MMSYTITQSLYDTVDAETSAYLQDKAQVCRDYITLGDTAYLKLGATLCEVKAYLKDNNALFGEWIATEFEQSHATANNAMRAYEQLGGNAPDVLASLAIRSQNILAQRKLDPARREWVLELAKTQDLNSDEVRFLAKGDIRIVTRYESGDLGLKQAVALSKAVQSAPPEVRELCLDEQVSTPQVIHYLSKVYPKRTNENSAWADIAHHKAVTVGEDTRPLSQVDATFIDLYQQERIRVARDAAHRAGDGATVENFEFTVKRGTEYMDIAKELFELAAKLEVLAQESDLVVRTKAVK